MRWMLWLCWFQCLHRVTLCLGGGTHSTPDCKICVLHSAYICCQSDRNMPCHHFSFQWYLADYGIKSPNPGESCKNPSNLLRSSQPYCLTVCPHHLCLGHDELLLQSTCNIYYPNCLLFLLRNSYP